MNLKNAAAYLLAIFLFLLLNVISQQSILYTIYNSFLFAFSLIFVYKTLNNQPRVVPLFIILTFLVPLFHFTPGSTILYIFPFAYIISWLIAYKLPRFKFLFITLGLILLLWGSLISNGILSFPIRFNPEHLIVHDQVISEIIRYHQKDARYVPYSVRLILFNRSVYLYTFLFSIANFLSLKNLYDILLLANLYPLAIGFMLAYQKRTQSVNYAVLLGLALTLIAAGLNKTPDKFNSLFTAAPLLFYLIVLGLPKVNSKYYVALFFVSIILLTNPI